MLYVGYFKPYSENLITYANLVTEGIISAFFLLALILNLYSTTDAEKVIDEIFVALIYVIFAVQSFTPTAVAGKKVCNKVLDSIRKRKVVPETSDKVEIISSCPDNKLFTISKSEPNR